MIKVFLFVELWLFWGFVLLWERKSRHVREVLFHARDSVEASVQKRQDEFRQSVILRQSRKGILFYLEKMFVYSGASNRLPFLTPELWLIFNFLGILLAVFLMILLNTSLMIIAILLGCFAAIQYLLFNYYILRNYNRTSEELLKFLDFLGNYSMTYGEVTSVLYQISAYLKEPLKSVLADCYYQAQTTGDVRMAILSMAEKIQHPKFRELVYNMEITMRYSANFGVLVSQSRKSVREYLKMCDERKALAKEAWINMLILGGMTVIILMAVERLLGIPVTEILFQTLVGRLCILGILVILLLFYGQVRNISK